MDSVSKRFTRSAAHLHRQHRRPARENRGFLSAILRFRPAGAVLPADDRAVRVLTRPAVPRYPRRARSPMPEAPRRGALSNLCPALRVRKPGGRVLRTFPIPSGRARTRSPSFPAGRFSLDSETMVTHRLPQGSRQGAARVSVPSSGARCILDRRSPDVSPEGGVLKRAFDRFLLNSDPLPCDADCWFCGCRGADDRSQRSSVAEQSSSGTTSGSGQRRSGPPSQRSACYNAAGTEP